MPVAPICDLSRFRRVSVKAKEPAMVRVCESDMSDLMEWGDSGRTNAERAWTSQNRRNAYHPVGVHSSVDTTRRGDELR